MISEIPTMAIEKVEMWQNTSIIPDENLAHRMGLVPILVDPRLFVNKVADKPYDETNSLRFKLHVVCSKKDPKIRLARYSKGECVSYLQLVQSEFWTKLSSIQILM